VTLAARGDATAIVAVTRGRQDARGCCQGSGRERRSTRPPISPR
jgi:hypothetical protein